MSPEPLDFSKRAYLSEWMDEPCSYETFRDCLLDLQKVNKTVRAYAPTEQWLQQIIGDSSTLVHIVDVGCGGGDVLRRIENWAQARNLPVKLTGIDLNPFAARAATEFCGGQNSIEWMTGDAFSYQPSVPIDIVVSSLFTHHLPDEDIVRFLAWMEQVARRGWFINDLHRGRVSFYGFKALSWIMQWHSFVRHDGPVSIRRSFSSDEWVDYCADAGLTPEGVGIRSVRPGRLCVSRVK